MSLDMPSFLRDYLSLTLFGYLNNHTMHHLFPAVDHGRLASAYDVYQETAKDFGLDPKDVDLTTFGHAFKLFCDPHRKHTCICLDWDAWEL